MRKIGKSVSEPVFAKNEHQNAPQRHLRHSFADRLSDMLDELVADDPQGALDYYEESGCVEVGEAVRKYADDNDLCRECLAPLVVVMQQHPYGSGWADERVRMCSKCAA